MCFVKYPDFTNLKALVTGASSGMGLEYARQLALKGCALVIVSNEEQIYEVARNIEQEHNVKVTPVCMDLARPEAAKELHDWCNNEGHEIDILINNAGMFMFRDVNETDPARIEALINLHILTLTQMCRYFSADMCRRRRGWVLNVSSLSPNGGKLWHSPIFVEQGLHSCLHPIYLLGTLRPQCLCHHRMPRRCCHPPVGSARQTTETGCKCGCTTHPRKPCKKSPSSIVQSSQTDYAGLHQPHRIGIRHPFAPTIAHVDKA